MSKQFIVKKAGSSTNTGPIFRSLNGNLYSKSDLHFVNVLEDPIPSELFKKLLDLDCHVSALDYHIVEHKCLEKEVKIIPKNERTHFSFNMVVHLLYCGEFPIRDCLSLARIFDGMSFDDLERLSRVIMRISNGFFRESALIVAAKEKIAKSQIEKYRSKSHEQSKKY